MVIANTRSGHVLLSIVFTMGHGHAWCSYYLWFIIFGALCAYKIFNYSGKFWLEIKLKQKRHRSLAKQINNKYKEIINKNAAWFWFINPFLATAVLLYPLKTSKNLWCRDAFSGYRKWPVAWNGLMRMFLDDCEKLWHSCGLFPSPTYKVTKATTGKIWNIYKILYDTARFRECPNWDK